MGMILFYHLTRSPVEETASLLLGKSLGAGWRVMLRGTNVARLMALDEQLWLGDDESFLPHGIAGSAQDADQPVLLGTGAITNAARALLLIDGAEPLPDEVAALERVWILFDGNDDAALQFARAQWKTLTAQGLHAQYWSEETGRWQMKTERKATN